MKRKVLNPFRHLPGYYCIGCSPDHEHGLRMEFFDDGEFIFSEWEPDPNFQGFQNVLHGGIQATMLDEVASWVVMTRLKTGGVTSRMDVRYLRKVSLDQGRLLIRGKLESFRHRIATVDAELRTSDGEIACQAKVQYYMLDEEKARQHLNYPGIEAFFETEGKE